MEAFATVRKTSGLERQYSLSPLQVAEIAASKAGFYDVDLVDNDAGVYQIVARARQRTVTAKGKTLTQAVERLLEALHGT